MSRGCTLNHTTVLVTEDCNQCAVIFALPRDMRNRRVEDHKTFYCPNGHAMTFSGPNEEEKRIKQLERQLANAESSGRWTQSQLEETRKERTALRGQLTKARKRAGAGICPVPECHRQFPNLRDHMETKHPTYTVPEPVVADPVKPVKSKVNA